MNREFIILLFSFFVASFISCNGSLSADNFEDSSFDSREDSLFRFIHISDTHGSTVTIDAVNEFCKLHPCDFIALTGDVVPNSNIIKSISKSRYDYLIIPGNHDADEKDGPGQYGFRTEFLDVLKLSVLYPEQKANYWYKDYEKLGKKLRVIGLDQFELNSFSNPSGLYAVMTQAQVNWFISVLEDSYDVDGLVVLIHMGFGNSSKGQRDTSVHNSFISELANLYNNSYDFYGPEDPYMIPEIINAYVTGEDFEKTYNKGNRYVKNASTHFEIPHNNFIGYFGGHLHWDEIEYLSAFPSQLQCLVAYCGQGTGSKLNDLSKSDYDYNFNLVDIDLFSNQLVITREGARQTIKGNSRNSIKFSLFTD